MKHSVFLGIFVTVVAAPALAQCEPDWNVEVGTPGAQDGYIDPMAPWNDGQGEKLYVGGSFSVIGGVAAESIASYDPVGKSWSRLGRRGLASGFLTWLLPWNDGRSEKLYVAGFFADADGLPGTSHLAAWDGSAWSSVGGGADFAVWALASGAFEGGRLYLGGSFAGVGGVAAKGIASWDGDNFHTVGTGVGVNGPFSPFISKMLAWDDGNGEALYVVGRFASIDGVNSPMLCKWDGSSWSQLGTGLIAPSSLDQLDAIAVHNDGQGEKLYVAGTPFRIPGQAGTFSAAKWNPQSKTWTPVGQNVGGRVTDLKSWDDGSGAALYLAGTATPGIAYFARLQGDSWTPAFGAVAGPPLPPSNFPSVFGLEPWGKDLLVGGNFSHVGTQSFFAGGIARLESCAGSCTGKEKLSLKCLDRGGSRIDLGVKVKRGTPDSQVTLRLNGDPKSDKVMPLNAEGAGKAKFKKAGTGAHAVEIVGCSASRSITCS